MATCADFAQVVFKRTSEHRQYWVIVILSAATFYFYWSIRRDFSELAATQV